MKQRSSDWQKPSRCVAPFAGAWIETRRHRLLDQRLGRPLRGGVD